MRLCRFGDNRLGLVDGSGLRDVTGALEVLPQYRYPLPSFDVVIANIDQVIERVRLVATDCPSLTLPDKMLLSPVANPNKIIGAPVNYQKHLEEVKSDDQINAGNQVIPIHKVGLFLKAPSALVGPSQGVALRKLDRRNDHEVELAVIMGKKANNVSAAKALEYVAGYTIGLDITVRGSEERSLRKSIDSYAVLGPWLVTKDEISNPNDLNLTLSVNGETRQNSNTKNMILDVRQLIEYASSFFTLYPGDVIMTGTPEGVSPIQPGDTMLAVIDKIGSMTVKVRQAD